MPNVASIHRCSSGLVILSKAVTCGLCKGCYFASYLDRGTGLEFETCLRHSSIYCNQNLPSCDDSLIYTKLRGK